MDSKGLPTSKLLLTCCNYAPDDIYLCWLPVCLPLNLKKGSLVLWNKSIQAVWSLAFRRFPKQAKAHQGLQSFASLHYDDSTERRDQRLFYHEDHWTLFYQIDNECFSFWNLGVWQGFYFDLRKCVCLCSKSVTLENQEYVTYNNLQ